MKLSSFPRPKGDNGRGIHWSPSTIHPRGEALWPWIDELIGMAVKWIKVLDDGDGSSVQLCSRLIENDMMPVVRLYRLPLYPGRLGRRHMETIRKLIDVGVRYFETGHEPDTPAVWKDDRLPRDWLQIAVNQFIEDADRILELGGLPSVPALSAQGQVDLVSQVVRTGRSDLFARGAWIAVHNYTLNHPPDYPEDTVNQQGTQLRRKEYELLGQWAWDGQARRMINIWRQQGMHPGHTIEEAFDCWRAFELANLMARESLGFSIPVIGTEGGAVIGWRDDRRYPRVTPELHRQWTVEINQYMQTEAPDYLFTTCHWLLANFRLGHHVMGWESQAWFTDWWEAAFDIKGELPTVQAVRDMPNNVRAMSFRESEVRGMMTDPAGDGVFGVEVELLSEGQVVGSTHTNARGRFRFSDLPAGTYEIRAPGWLEGEYQVDLGSGEVETPQITLVHGQRSIIRGQVVSADGQPMAGVPLQLTSANLSKDMISDGEGRFLFNDLRAGRFRISAGSGFIAGIDLDGWGEWEGVLILPPSVESRYAVVSRRLLDQEENDGRHLFFGRVLDEHGVPLNGVTVEMSWFDAAPGTIFPTVVTGHGPQAPAGYYEFVNTPGQFQLRVLAPGSESEVATDLDTTDLPGLEGEPLSYEVVFQRQIEPACGSSSMAEIALPGCSAEAHVTLRSQDVGRIWEPASRDNDQILFTRLPKGRYDIEVSNLGFVGSVDVDGFNSVRMRIPLGGLIRVEISPKASAGRLRLLTIGGQLVREEQCIPGEMIELRGLPPGDYQLHYLGWQSEPLHLQADQIILVKGVDSRPRDDASLEGRLLNSEGEMLSGRQVVLRAGEEVRGIQQTDRSGRYRFAGLSRGIYALHVEEAGVVEDAIELAEGESKLVDLVLPAEAEQKMLEHYLLLPRQSNPGPWVTLLLLQAYIQHFEPTVGFDPQEACTARKVTIAGDRTSIDQATEDFLLGAGCLVERLPGDSYELAETLRRLQREL